MFRPSLSRHQEFMHKQREDRDCAAVFVVGKRELATMRLGANFDRNRYQEGDAQ